MTARRTSSSCTGAFTAEMACAVLEKTINDSRVLANKVSFRPVSATDPSSVDPRVSELSTSLSKSYQLLTIVVLHVSQNFQRSP